MIEDPWKSNLVATLCSSIRIGKMIIQAAKMNPHHDAHSPAIIFYLVVSTPLQKY